MFNILIAGAAGQGIDTAVALLEWKLKESGWFIHTTRDVMSRVRGGHNFTLLRFSRSPIYSHSLKAHIIAAFNLQAVSLHKHQLIEGGCILSDGPVGTGGLKVIDTNAKYKALHLGNPHVAGSIFAGALLHLINEPLDGIEKAVNRLFTGEKVIALNLKALQIGYELVDEPLPLMSSAARQDAGDDEIRAAEGNAAGDTTRDAASGTINDTTSNAAADWLLLSANQAIALGAVSAGIQFYSGYPMSPSTPVMDTLAELAAGNEALPIVVEQAEDEIGAINMALGASYAGAIAMTATSGGGFSLMVEALGLAGIAELPLVIVNVQRPGPATGLPTRTEQGDLRFVVSASHGEFPRLVIAVKNAEDAFYQTKRALQIAAAYEVPVILLSDQYLGEGTAITPALQADWEPELKGLAELPPVRSMPGRTDQLVRIDSDEHDEDGLITESAEVRIRMTDKRLHKLEVLRKEVLEPEYIGPEDCDILLIGWGSLWGGLKEAVELLNSRASSQAEAAGQMAEPEGEAAALEGLPTLKKNDGKTKGLRYGALVFGDVWPLPVQEITARAGRAKKLINVEQNATGQLAGLLREATGIACHDSLLKYDGRQWSGEEIADALIERLLAGEEEQK